MHYRAINTVAIAAISVFLLGWANAVRMGGGVPAPAGGPTFCDTAPTNKYCMDFEVPGGNCAAESPAWDSSSPAICGNTTGTLGDDEWMVLENSSDIAATNVYTHTDAHCGEIMFQKTDNPNGAVSFLAMIRDTGVSVFPQLRLTGAGKFQLFCASSRKHGNFFPTAGVLYQIRWEFTNSNAEGSWWLDDVFQGSCNGTSDDEPDDTGIRMLALSDQETRIDNFIIKSGLCP